MAITGSTAFVAGGSTSTYYVDGCTVVAGGLSSCSSAGAGFNGRDIAINGTNAIITGFYDNTVKNCAISGTSLSCSATSISIQRANGIVIDPTRPYAYVSSIFGYIYACPITGSGISTPCTTAFTGTPTYVYINDIAISGTTAVFAVGSATGPPYYVVTCTISSATPPTFTSCQGFL
jgi:hypothetical protein